MKTVRNLTKLPIRIPLPHNKVLRLAPGKAGQVKDDAADKAPFQKMIEDGKIEIVVGGGPAPGAAGKSSSPARRTSNAGASGSHRKTGDR